MSARDLIAAFAAPAIAAVAIGVSAALASGSVFGGAAYGGPVTSLSKETLTTHANTVFARADLDRSGGLDINEYAALAIVTAELARLNGFVAFETGADAPQIVELPIASPSAMSSAERARVDAVARQEFYDIASDGVQITRQEFVGDMQERFAAADRFRTGVLKRGDLVSFAAREAMLLRTDA